MQKKVRKFIRLKNTTISPDENLERAWKLLARHDISLLAVDDKDKTLLGVIGEDDLVYQIVPDYIEYFSEFFPEAPEINDLEDKFNKEINQTPKDIMNRKCFTMHIDKPLFKALTKMMAYNVRALPVIDDERRYQGMIIEDDIMSYIFNKHLKLVKRRK